MAIYQFLLCITNGSKWFGAFAHIVIGLFFLAIDFQNLYGPQKTFVKEKDNKYRSWKELAYYNLIPLFHLYTNMYSTKLVAKQIIVNAMIDVIDHVLEQNQRSFILWKDWIVLLLKQHNLTHCAKWTKFTP